MIHNLTDKQLCALRWLVQQIDENNLKESIYVVGRQEDHGIAEYYFAGASGIHAPECFNFGALEALVADGALVSQRDPKYDNSCSYTLMRRAYEIAAFDFDNPEPDPINLYMKKAYYLIRKSFNREELEGLCLELGFQSDWVFGDKTDWPLHLLLYLYRQNQLGDLPSVLKKLRPEVTWPQFPGVSRSSGE